MKSCKYNMLPLKLVLSNPDAVYLKVISLIYVLLFLCKEFARVWYSWFQLYITKLLQILSNRLLQLLHTGCNSTCPVNQNCNSMVHFACVVTLAGFCSQVSEQLQCYLLQWCFWHCECIEHLAWLQTCRATTHISPVLSWTGPTTDCTQKMLLACSRGCYEPSIITCSRQLTISS